MGARWKKKNDETGAETVLNLEFILAFQITTNSFSTELWVLEQSVLAYLYTEY